MQQARLGILATCIAALGGCASVHIYKASTTGLAPDGSRDDGIPFYLPRPYVQVYEPFVVKSDAYLVTGRVSDDGQFLLLENVPTELASVVKVATGEDRVPAIRVSAIQRPKPSEKKALQNGRLENKDVDEAAGSPDAAISAASAASPASSAASAASKSDQTTSAPTSGKSSLAVTQAATAFPPTLGRRFFDIVWLPDWDEKYILKSSPGLGNSKVAVTMVQGWGLHGVDATLDNEVLAKPLIGLYSDSLSALSKLAQSTIFPAGALQSATIEEGAKGAKAAKQQLLTVKVTKVSIAAPGVYPILKPKESAEATAIPDKSIAAKVLIPQRPYTNVAFNIYDVFVVEATKPFGDSPMNLQRYFDVGGATGGGSDSPASSDRGNSTNSTDNASKSNGAQRNVTFNEANFIKKANADLSALSAAGEGTWVVKTAGASAQRLTVNVELQGGSAPAKAPDKNSLKAVFAKHSPFASVNSILVP